MTRDFRFVVLIWRKWKTMTPVKVYSAYYLEAYHKFRLSLGTCFNAMITGGIFITTLHNYNYSHVTIIS